jgi:cytochrome c oxidase assembly factor CtaG
VAASLSFWNWDFEPTITFGLIALVVLYVLARRNNWFPAHENVRLWLPSARWRPWCFAAGVVTMCIALQSPIDRGGDRFLLSIHMVQHLLLMMVAPPLLLLGIAGASPLNRLHGLVWRAWLLITRPWPACLIFNATLLVWHIPALYNTTLTDTPLHVFEHITFIVAGVIFWWPLVDPVRHSRYSRIGSFEKIAVLSVAGIPPTVLGFILAITPLTFYQFYAVAPRLWGISVSADQQIAGVIMFGLGNLIYFVAIGVIFLRLFGDPVADEADALRVSAR